MLAKEKCHPGSLTYNFEINRAKSEIEKTLITIGEEIVDILDSGGNE